MSYNKMEQRLLNNGRNGNIVARSYKAEDNEKTALQQPVRLQPSWEENNLPEDELNFKNLTMADASLQINTPRDRYNLVYLTFILHGVGVLMPWNMFINSFDYFTKYKFGKDYIGEETSYATSFIQYLCFAAQVPNIILNYTNIFVNLGGSLTPRIVYSIGAEVILFVVTVVLAMTDTRSWPGAFFMITMLTVILINGANGVYQNTIFGMAAKLPGKYTGAVVLGSNISGTFTSIVVILSDVFASSQRMSAIYYFITALFVLLICFDTYFALPLNRFYRHHELREQKEKELEKRNNAGKAENIPYGTIVKQCLVQLYNVIMVFFCSLAVFPAVSANIQSSDENFIIGPKFYTNVLCFLTFNVSAMLGSALASIYQFPKPKYLWIPVTLRLLYIPLYLLCNYQVHNIARILPVLVTSDWIYWFVGITLGLTSGYFSSVAMMYVPRCVEPRYAGVAGMFGAAALITGIFAGILSAFLWPWLIANVG